MEMAKAKVKKEAKMRYLKLIILIGAPVVSQTEILPGEYKY